MKTEINRKNDLFPTDINFLILEDMNQLRFLLVKNLIEIGIEGKIYEAANVQTAMNICKMEEVGFVISDWNLPDGNGHDFLKSFRAIERYKKTPFIMCTTNNEVQYFLDAIASGANDYLVKPWSADELKKKINLTWTTYLQKK